MMDKLNIGTVLVFLLLVIAVFFAVRAIQKGKTGGCGAAIATSSMATDLVKGKTIPEALKLTNKAVMEALDGLPAIKIHCSVLAEQAIKAAVSDYYRRRGIDPTPIVGEIKDADEAHEHGVSEEDE